MNYPKTKKSAQKTFYKNGHTPYNKMNHRILCTGKSPAFSVYIEREAATCGLLLYHANNCTLRGRCMIMTTINCSKPCQYQIDGKCCCDSILIPYNHKQKETNSDCLYQVVPEKLKTKSNQQFCKVDKLYSKKDNQPTVN